MGIFDKVRKLLRGDKPLPNQHGPRIALQKEEKFEERVQSFPPVRVTVVKATTGTNPGCACGGNCACGTKPAVTKKPVAKSTEKKIAIQKDLEDTPVAVKPVSKKTVPNTEPKKTPVKKVTKPVSKDAPKAQPKPAAKKPAPKKK